MKFIFEVKIKSSYTAKQYIEAWQKGSAIIQRQPGAMGTKLYRKSDEDNTFIAIATWASKQSRDSAMEALKQVDPETRKILDAHKLYGDITVIGNFENNEWEVTPETS